MSPNENVQELAQAIVQAVQELTRPYEIRVPGLMGPPGLNYIGKLQSQRYPTHYLDFVYRQIDQDRGELEIRDSYGQRVGLLLFDTTPQ